VAGFAALLPRNGFCELDGLFVEPDLWGKGVGRALIADALARTRTLETVANPRAEGFYKRLGFSVIGEAQTQFGPARRMGISALSGQT
jgi:GNAT superfamily N-acetyltransferase